MNQIDEMTLITAILENSRSVAFCLSACSHWQAQIWWHTSVVLDVQADLCDNGKF